MSNAIEAEEPRRPRLWLRIGIGLGVFALALVALGVVKRSRDGQRLAGRIGRIQADLDATDPGWRLEDLLAKRVDPPAGKNSADVIAFVAARLPAGWPGAKTFDAVDHARPPHRLAPEARAVLDAELKKHDAAVQAARTLTATPTGRHPLTLVNIPWAIQFDAQQRTRLAAALLQYDAVRLADAGDVDAAVRSCHAIVNAAHSLADEPFLVSQFIRLSVAWIGASYAEVVLALGEASDPALAGLQAGLRPEAGGDDLLLTFRGERAWTHDVLMKLMDGRIPIEEAFDPEVKEKLKDEWWYRVFGYTPGDVRRDYPAALEHRTQVVEIARLPPHEQDAALGALPEMPQRYPLVGNFSTSIARMVAVAFHRKLAMVRSMHALIGVERYRLANKRWPNRLEDIPPALLPGGVPLDPFDGKPLRYRRTADGVVVYSVGEDRTDDGGTVVDEEGRVRRPGPGGDQGYRLWEPHKRRQPALPLPPPPVPDEGPP